MTYIIGWKKENCVFLSGDIAITRRRKLNIKDARTIFGGKLINKVDLSVTEECLKLFKINNKLIAAIVGKVEPALNLIEQMKMYIDENDTVKWIKFITNTLQDNKEQFALFIGAIDKDDQARLFSFNFNGDNKLLEHESPIQDGSLDKKYKKYTTDLCTNVNKIEEASNADILAIVNIVHQNIIIRDSLLENGVGGIFWGLKLDEEGVDWQNDTSLVIFEFNEDEESGELNTSNNPKEIFKNSAIVHIVERDNAIRYATPYKGKGRGRNVVYNCLDHPRTIQDFNKKKEMVIKWHTKWREETNTIFKYAKSEYIGFIARSSNLTPKITIFSREQLSNFNISITLKANGIYKISTPGNSLGDFIESIRPIETDNETDYIISYSI